MRGSVTKANGSGSPNLGSAGSRPEHCLELILFFLSLFLCKHVVRAVAPQYLRPVWRRRQLPGQPRDDGARRLAGAGGATRLHQG